MTEPDYSNYARCRIPSHELVKLAGMPRERFMPLVFQVLDRAGISTTHPKEILYQRRGNDAYFIGPRHTP